MASLEEILKQLQESPDQLDSLRQQFSSANPQPVPPVPAPEAEPNEELLKKVGVLKNPRPMGGIFDFATAALHKTPPLVERQENEGEGPSAAPMSEEDRAAHINNIKSRRLAAIGDVPETPDSSVPQRAPAQSLTSILDFGQNKLASQEGLLQAQDNQRNLQFLANMNRAGAQVAQGLAQTGKLDTSVADSVEKQGKTEVDNYIQKVDFQKQDPNSSYSKGLRDYFKNKLGIEIRGDASAAELEKIHPLVVRQFEAESNRESLKQQKANELAYRKEKDTADRQIRKDAIGAKAEEKADKATETKTKAQSKAKQEAINFLESSRNTPDVRQAMLDKYNIGKAELIMKDKDLNNLSSQEVELLVSEIGKIARGGVPTKDELKALSPSTLSGQLSKEWSKLSNKPTSLNAGAFLKRYQAYLLELKKNASDVVSKKVKRVIQAKKREMGQEDYDDLQTVYKDMLSSEDEPSGKTVAKRGYNSATNQTQLIYSDGTKEIVDGKQ